MPTWSQIDKPSWYLLINSTDYLLINASGDRLITTDVRDDMYTNIVKPT